MPWLTCMPSEAVTLLVHSRGKMTAFKQVKLEKTCQDAFKELGRLLEVSTALFQKLQEITCHLYMPSTHANGGE